MRFLNFKLASPDSGGIKIEFTEGLNIISVQDREHYELLSGIFYALVSGNPSGSFRPDNSLLCSMKISSGKSEKEISLENIEGNLILKLIKDDENIDINNTEANSGSNNPLIIQPWLAPTILFSPEQIQKGIDPVFESKHLKELLVSHELGVSGIPYFEIRGEMMRKIEIELTDLNRERQLLELKKMKRDKLVKEISQTEKQISKLEKKRESQLNYKMSLREISTYIESKNRLSSKISGLKKDLMELRGIKSKINSLEKTLKEKFSHFADRGNDQLPDLEQIQYAFNAFRDINEQLDKFYVSKKRYIDWATRIITSIVIFSLTALFFMLFTSSASNTSKILGTTSAVAGCVAIIAGAACFFKFKNYQPNDLLENRKKLESELIELLKRNNFAVDGYRTGEIYEVLFQYFEDFINYRDISLELLELKKRISGSTGINDRDNKLDELNAEMQKIDSDIKDIVSKLDTSVYHSPDIDDPVKTIHDIDELLTENELEISQKKSLISKINENVEEYDRTENSGSSIEILYDDLMKQINEKKDRLEHIRLIESILNKSADIWSSARLKDLSSKALDYFITITGKNSIKDEIAAVIDDIVLNSGRVKSEYRGFKKYLSISIKAAASDLINASDLPPMIMINPFADDNEFTENIKKLLPEMFSARQILILIPGTAPDIFGNIINI